MIKYKPCKKLFRKDGEQQEKWIATKVQHRHVPFDKLIDRVVNASSATRGDVELVISELISQIEDALADGMSVKVGRLGTFDLSISSDLYDSPEDITPSRVKFNKLFFRAGTELRRAVQANSEFKRME